MKNLILCGVLLYLLFACSSESEFQHSENSNNSESIEKGNVFPLNPANPYDTKGQKYYNAIQKYSQNNSTPNSIEEITLQINFLSELYNHKDLHKNANLGFTAEEISAILDNPSVKLLEIVDNCSITTSSKSQLILFVQTLIAQQDQEYSNIREYIISFDDAIIESVVLTGDEKEIILTVSTISSYALYAEAERKDRDWETSVGTKHGKTFFQNNDASLISIIALLDVVVHK